MSVQGSRPSSAQAIKDGYAGLKTLIRRKYAKVKVDQLEVDPNSKNRRGVFDEELAAADANKDPELVPKAQELLEAAQRLAPETAAVTGVDLKDIEGASLAIRRVIATGTGYRLRKP